MTWVVRRRRGFIARLWRKLVLFPIRRRRRECVAAKTRALHGVRIKSIAERIRVLEEGSVCRCCGAFFGDPGGFQRACEHLLAMSECQTFFRTRISREPSR